jgi:cysteine desulfurase
LLDQAGICASKGSACLGNSDGPSHVIKAMKPKGLISRQSVRFSLGVQSTEADVDACLAALKQGVALLRT